MLKFTENKAHPSLAASARNLTKAAFKQAYQVWRSLDKYDRINFIENTSDYRICHFVELDSNSVDPLLVKSVRLAIRIEQSQMMKAA